MTSLLNEIRNAFDWYGIKTVTRTDIRKSAYVLTADQVQVLEHAGVKPKREAVVPIRVIGSNQILKSTYYHSRRVGSGRRPEPRMGRAIVRWLRAGDRLLLATDGTTVFARKVQRSDRTRRPPGELEPAIEAVYRAIDPGRLLAHAKRVSGAPRRSSGVVEQFERSIA